MKRFYLFVVAAVCAFSASYAAVPSGYYSSAEGKKGQALLTQLYNIINSHTKVSYDGLWDLYKTSDKITKTVNGTATDCYWDMYATTSFPLGQKHCGNYSKVGDCVNREHSLPKSWWGSTRDERYSDGFHLYPTDGYVNNQRASYPFGECANGEYVEPQGTNRPLGKLGTSTYSGYTGKVFEPDDEYKGDFARTYFYMVTCYNNTVANWNSPMLAENKYPAFTTWAMNMLLEWHRQDPVSEKEINRNEAVYAKQRNRNPYIDYPELAEHVWGTQTSVGWVPGGVSTTPVLIHPVATSTLDLGIAPINTTLSGTITVKGQNLTKDLTVSLSGNHSFKVNGTNGNTTITAADANNGVTLNVTFIYAAAITATNTLTISSSEVSATVSLMAQVVDGIPAQAATNVTDNSFTANWTNVSGSSATYQLYVYDSADGVLDGYPKNVTASAQSYNVTGLDANTTYKYKLTYSTIESNVVTVTTLVPTPVIGISEPTAGLTISCAPGEASPILEASVYTENITEDVDVDVTGNFELSLNKTTWAQSITIDPEGETFYVRIKDTSSAGTFNGTITASTYSLDGTNIDVTGIVAEAKTFIEDWEDLTTGGYWTKEVQGNMCSWNFDNAGIWADTHKNGGLSCRFGKNANSSIYMLEDKLNGASTVSFYAAKWSDSEATPKVDVMISTDAGTTWTAIAQDVELDATWKLYSYSDLKIQGNVRLKIQQTAGARFNIDDISITDYKVSTIIENVVNNRTWDAYANGRYMILESSKATDFEVYDIDARLVKRITSNGRTSLTLPVGMYIVSADGASKKVIVK